MHRVFSISKTSTISITINNIVSRFSTSYRILTENISIQYAVERVASFFRIIIQTIQMLFSYVIAPIHIYPSVQYDVPNFTDSSTKDVKFYKVVQLDNTYGSSESQSIEVTLPSGVDTWSVYDVDGSCTGSVKASGTGNVVRWNIDAPIGGKDNETICYEYTSGATMSMTSFVQDLSMTSNLSRQFLNASLTFTENVGEAFNVSWDVTGKKISGSTCLENCTYLNHSADGGFTTFVRIYVDKILETIGDRVQGSAEILKKTSWRKDVYLKNDWSQTLKINVTVDLPNCYTGNTNDNYVVNPGGGNETIENQTGLIAWTETLTAGQSGTWTVYFKTPIINVTRNETGFSGGNWYRWVNISSVCIKVEDVKSYAPTNESYLSIRLYDNTSGDMTDITDEESYNVNHIANIINWTIPELSANRAFVIAGMAVNCSIQTREITNEPLRIMETAKWEEIIVCENLKNVYTEYSQKWRLPFDARLIRLDDVPKERSFDEYGAYIMIKGSLAGLSSATYNLTYQTGAVTGYVKQELPSVFFVNEWGKIKLNITLKNWAEDEIDEIEESIPIVYGESLYLCENLTSICNSTNSIDYSDLVSGSYTLDIKDMGSLETKEYTIVYEVPTATGKFLNDYREIVNGTALVVREYHVKTVSPLPLQAVKYEIEDVNYSNVVKIVDTDGIMYEYEEGSVIVNMGAMHMGKDVTLKVYSSEAMAIELPQWSWEWLEWMIWDLGVDMPILGHPMKVKHALLVFGVFIFILIAIKFDFRSKIERKIRGETLPPEFQF